MVSHKFAVGDRVRLTLDRYAESSPWDIHTISRKLPAEGNICQYRVKRVGDGQERTVSETPDGGGQGRGDAPATRISRRWERSTIFSAVAIRMRGRAPFRREPIAAAAEDPFRAHHA